MSLILGLETSCDETSAAVVLDGREVLGHVVASQHELHAEFGGVVPEVASRAHLERLRPVLLQTLDEAGLDLSAIDGVAVGNRPGLIGSLLVGVSAAQALSWSVGVPLIAIDHVRAHLYAGYLGQSEKMGDEPAGLGLVVSGGHTQIYRMEAGEAGRSAMGAAVIGRTIDDAVGEAFDKAAVILGLGFPGGPAVERCAAAGDAEACDFPVSMLSKESLDFSFSGLKTALLYRVRGRPKTVAGKPVFEREAGDLAEAERADLAAGFQRAAVAAVVKKLDRAAERVAEVGRLVVGGGVTANRSLRSALAGWAERRGARLVIPEMAYCVDNAAMIAGLAAHRLAAGEVDGLGIGAVSTS
ncbi:tRNA (adenosine(37)-N6)-threonylcarbamoyltransferase complex transferase subunit TsaD [Mucisphaera sp.]|uniref:tRNA (adenosine(37)-N6)-threonylcarbamoyltransferase complex transferase subunit TsaD n=1 Tax=Mucisphaera sp. TaxID=2913024 RepID=UPI003D0CBB98